VRAPLSVRAGVGTAGVGTSGVDTAGVGAAGVRAARRLGVPSGGVVRGRLGELQRARIVGAMFEVVARRGAGGVTVADVVERAGVSRRTFYENFEDREACLLVSFERALVLACERVVPAFEAGDGWRERVRAGLVALLAFCDEQPSVARLLLFESQASGVRVARRRGEVLGYVTGIVDQGRLSMTDNNSASASSGGGREGVSRLTAEAAVGGVLAVIDARLTDPGRGPLVALAGELMSMIVLPYLGSGAARREMERPLPPSAPVLKAPSDGFVGDPFKGAGMRLTYRTVRVLVAIAEHPGASNRLVGEAAQVRDQGQISKLLARLSRAGMISNGGVGPGTGAPNAWTLTPSGRQVTDSVRAHTMEGLQ
jgi:AcrR family transcriptional regulator